MKINDATDKTRRQNPLQKTLLNIQIFVSERPFARVEDDTTCVLQNVVARELSSSSELMKVPKINCSHLLSFYVKIHCIGSTYGACPSIVLECKFY